MWWLLIWASILVVAGVYLGSRAWALWGQTKELGSELAIAQRRLDAVQGQLQVLGEIGRPEEPAIFASPAAARQQRDRARAAGRRARRQRRAVSHPGLGKHVD